MNQEIHLQTSPKFVLWYFHHQWYLWACKWVSNAPLQSSLRIRNRFAGTDECKIGISIYLHGETLFHSPNWWKHLLFLRPFLWDPLTHWWELSFRTRLRLEDTPPLPYVYRGKFFKVPRFCFNHRNFLKYSKSQLLSHQAISKRSTMTAVKAPYWSCLKFDSVSHLNYIKINPVESLSQPSFCYALCVFSCIWWQSCPKRQRGRIWQQTQIT